MANFTREQYIHTYKNAPQGVRDIAVSAHTAEKLRLIYARHEVDDKAFNISAVIGYTLVGLIPIKNFIQTLQEDAELDAETAKHIAYDVRSQIFAPIAEQLATLQPEDKTAAVSSQTEETPPAQHDKPIPEDNIVDLSNKLR